MSIANVEKGLFTDLANRIFGSKTISKPELEPSKELADKFWKRAESLKYAPGSGPEISHPDYARYWNISAGITPYYSISCGTRLLGPR